MPQSVIPAFDRQHGRPLATIAASAVVATSADLGWRGIVVEHYRHPPMEMTEMVLPNHHLTLQLSGPLIIERLIDGRFQARRTEPGSFTLTSANTPLQARWREPVEILAIALDPSFMAALIHDTTIAARAFIPQFAPQDARIAGIGQALLAELAEGGPNGPLFVEGLTTALTLHLLRQYQCPPWQPLAAPCGLSPHDLRRVRDYMHAHLTDAISLGDLAQVVGLSPSRFAALFKHSTGEAPYHALLGLRVARAQDLLLHSSLPLGIVARQAGFANQSHMTRHVRRLLGSTPLTLRRGRP